MKRVPDEKCASMCGLFCGACPAFPEECHGCLSDLVREGCRDCARHGFLDCTQKHGVTRCYECGEFPCEKLREFSTKPVINGICNHADVISDGYRMKEIGVSQWVREKIAAHQCPVCGELITWFERGTHRCKKGQVKMRLERIINAAHPMYQRVLELYRASFPYHEQRETFSQEQILGDNEYHFSLIYDADVFVGLVLFWETEDFIYIEHLCILPEMRNKQYGQKLLSFLQEKQKLVILEIDPPVDDISRRRKGFYERCSFTENPFPHIHPPYHRGVKGHSLVVMTSPGAISQEKYEVFHQYLCNRIMKDAF